MEDIIVIGAGPAGVLAALRRADLGARTVLVARSEFGGMAANDGPVPVRMFAPCGRLIREAWLLGEYGIAVGELVLDYCAWLRACARWSTMCVRIPPYAGSSTPWPSAACGFHMAAQYSMGLTVRDQLTKTELATVDNRARSRVEAYNVGDDVACFTGLFFGKVSLGIFRVREAGGRILPVPGWASSDCTRHWQPLRIPTVLPAERASSVQ